MVITKELILEYEAQGWKIPAIANKLGCDKHLLYRIKRGVVQKTGICRACGNEFAYTTTRERVTCAKKECQQKMTALGNASPGLSPFRPFSDTANMMIVLNLDEGMSIPQIAQMYNRDPEDVKLHIKSIINDGTADKIRRIVSNHKKYNTLMGGAGLI